MSLPTGDAHAAHPHGTADLRYRLRLQQRALARNPATCGYCHAPHLAAAARIAGRLIAPGCETGAA